jgi:ketosteroid isomerase-like protein
LTTSDQDNVELVRDLLEAFRRRDHERAFDFYDPHIEWDARWHPSPDVVGIYHGHEGVRTYWRRWLSAWSDLEFVIDDVQAGDGGQVVAVIRDQHQWGRHSGVETEVPPYGLIFTIRDGKVVRWQSFVEPEAALKAAGLEA